MLQRAPRHPALRSCVAALWAADGSPDGARAAPEQTEVLLPTGATHLVLRLATHALTLYEADAGLGADAGWRAAPWLVGGARARYYVRRWSGMQCSVGAVLRPGAAWPLLGAPAGELAGRHWALDGLWGAAAEALRQRLAECDDAAGRLALLEQELLRRLSRASRRQCTLHPGVAAALACARAASPLPPVGDLVAASGLSHRRLLLQFVAATGLRPKEALRVSRLRRALPLLQRGLPLAEVAAVLGYSDQAHLTREFVHLAGMTPGDYRRAAPVRAHHVGKGQIPARPAARSRPSSRVRLPEPIR